MQQLEEEVRFRFSSLSFNGVYIYLGQEHKFESLNANEEAILKVIK